MVDGYFVAAVWSKYENESQSWPKLLVLLSVAGRAPSSACLLPVSACLLPVSASFSLSQPALVCLSLFQSVSVCTLLKQINLKF